MVKNLTVLKYIRTEYIIKQLSQWNNTVNNELFSQLQLLCSWIHYKTFHGHIFFQWKVKVYRSVRKSEINPFFLLSSQFFKVYCAKNQSYTIAYLMILDKNSIYLNARIQFKILNGLSFWKHMLLLCVTPPRDSLSIIKSDSIKR